MASVVCMSEKTADAPAIAELAPNGTSIVTAGGEVGLFGQEIPQIIGHLPRRYIPLPNALGQRFEANAARVPWESRRRTGEAVAARGT